MTSEDDEKGGEGGGRPATRSKLRAREENKNKNKDKAIVTHHASPLLRSGSADFSCVLFGDRIFLSVVERNHIISLNSFFVRCRLLPEKGGKIPTKHTYHSGQQVMPYMLHDWHAAMGNGSPPGSPPVTVSDSSTPASCVMLAVDMSLAPDGVTDEDMWGSLLLNFGHHQTHYTSYGGWTLAHE